MVIGLDIDDTITDTLSVMLAYAEKFTIEDLHKEIDIKQFTSEMLNTAYVQTIHNWNKEDEEKFFKKYFRVMIQKTIPFFFAVETINKLKAEGHKIILITARENCKDDYGDVDVVEETTKWLEKYGIQYDKLIVNAIDKGEIALENNVDVFVDDSLKNCINVHNKGIKTFIMDNRCNVNSNADGVTRVYTWAHLENELRKEIG